MSEPEIGTVTPFNELGVAKTLHVMADNFANEGLPHLEAAYRLAARALTGERDVEIMREIANNLSLMRSNRAGFNVLNAITFIKQRADEIEARIKGGES